MSRPSEGRAVSTTGGGTTLSTTAVLIPLASRGRMSGVGQLNITPRNTAGAAIVKFALTPRISVLIVTDGFAGLPGDESDDAQDDSVSTDVTISSMPGWPNGAIYVGAPGEFRGLRADIDAANSNASVLTGDYWNGAAWANATITDGTASGGATMAIDGDITFTPASAWQVGRLLDILGKNGVAAFQGQPAWGSVLEIMDRPLFWLRLKPSLALDASTTLNSLMALARTTNYDEIRIDEGVEFEGPDINTDVEGLGAVEALVDAGAASLIVALRGEGWRP